MVEKLTGRNIIKQSYGLNLSTYDLSEVSLNLLFTLLTEITNDTKEICVFKVKISELHRKMNMEIKRNSYEKIAKELMSSPIKVTSETGTVNYYNWCSRFSFNTREGWLEMEIHKELKDYLTNLTSHFGISYLNEFLQIKGSYAKRMYMIFRQYSKLKFVTFSIEELRNILMLNDKFNLYADMKKKVIVSAINNINKNSSLNISFEEFKVGRKVNSLKFNIVSERSSSLEHKAGVSATESWLENK